MPRIQQYESPQASRGIDTQGLESAAHRIGIMGRENADSIRSGLQALGSGIGQAGEAYGLYHEAPVLAKQRADLEAKIQLGTDDFFKNADPDDPDLHQKYQDWLGKQIDDFGNDTITGKGAQVANAMRDEMRNHFTSVGLADASNVAGSAVVSAMEKSANNRTQMVMSDPSQYEYAQRAFQQDYDLFVGSHHLTPEQTATLQREYLIPGQKAIAVASMRASAERNPEQLEKDIAAGRYTSVAGEQEIKEARAYGTAQSHAQVEAQKSAAEEYRRQQKEDFAAKSSALTASFLLPDGSMAVPPDAPTQIAKLALHPGATPGEIRSLADMASRINRENSEGKKAVTDPHVYEDFRTRLTLNQDDPRALTDEQIIEARANGTLSDKDYGFFKGAVSTLAKDPAYKVAQQQFKTFLRGIRSSITNSNILMGHNDPTGDLKYLQYTQTATDAFEHAYKQGAWKDLLDRNAKGSLWQMAVPYMTGLKESMQNLQNSAQGSVGLVPSVQPKVKWTPGMSMDELAKKVGP